METIPDGPIPAAGNGGGTAVPRSPRRASAGRSAGGAATLSRGELYAEVWSVPMLRLGSKFHTPAALREMMGRDSGAFFPIVGMAPVEDGGLLAAALFIAGKLGLPTAATPRAFLETLAVTNWCKFVIQARTNRDYVGDVEKLTASLPFVVAELAALRPAVVLLPHRVWGQPELAAAMRGASPLTRFAPAPQCNVKVVDKYGPMVACHERGLALRERLQATPLGEWMRHLVGFREENAWRYIAWLDGNVVVA